MDVTFCQKSADLTLPKNDGLKLQRPSSSNSSRHYGRNWCL